MCIINNADTYSKGNTVKIKLIVSVDSYFILYYNIICFIIFINQFISDETNWTTKHNKHIILM